MAISGRKNAHKKKAIFQGFCPRDVPCESAVYQLLPPWIMGILGFSFSKAFPNLRLFGTLGILGLSKMLSKKPHLGKPLKNRNSHYILGKAQGDFLEENGDLTNPGCKPCIESTLHTRPNASSQSYFMVPNLFRLSSTGIVHWLTK